MVSLVAHANFRFHDRFQRPNLSFAIVQFAIEVRAGFGKVGNVVRELFDFLSEQLHKFYYQRNLLLAKLIPALLQSLEQEVVLQTKDLEFVDPETYRMIDTADAATDFRSVAGQAF